MVRWMIALASVATVLTIAGCGSGYTPVEGVIVTGKVLQGGQPVAITPTDDGYNGVEVQFAPADPTAMGLASTIGRCNASGDFEIAYEGVGIPPGKYKVAVYIRKDNPEVDLLEGKLDPSNSTIEFDIPKDKVGGKHDVGSIDVGPYLK